MLPSSFGVKALGKTPFSRYRRSFGDNSLFAARQTGGNGLRAAASVSLATALLLSLSV